MHFAITGQTAAEIIHDRADSGHPTMGLTTWKASPDGKIIKSDVKIEKNYLNESELTGLTESLPCILIMLNSRLLTRMS
jgi:hypothetical protein